MIQYEKNLTMLETHRKLEEFIELYQEMKLCFPDEKIPFLSESELQCKNKEILIYFAMKFTYFLKHIVKTKLINEKFLDFLKENVKFTKFQYISFIFNHRRTLLSIFFLIKVKNLLNCQIMKIMRMLRY